MPENAVRERHHKVSLRKRKNETIAKLQTAKILVERLEKENHELDQLLVQAEVNIKNGKRRK